MVLMDKTLRFNVLVHVEYHITWSVKQLS